MKFLPSRLKLNSKRKPKNLKLSRKRKPKSLKLKQRVLKNPSYQRQAPSRQRLIPTNSATATS